MRTYYTVTGFSTTGDYQEIYNELDSVATLQAVFTAIGEELWEMEGGISLQLNIQTYEDPIEEELC